MNIGLKHDGIFKFFHPNALDMFDRCRDLKEVCNALRDPSIRVSESVISFILQFEPGKSFSPMLAKRIGFPVDTKLDANLTYLIEMKFDGERILCHKVFLLNYRRKIVLKYLQEMVLIILIYIHQY